MSTIKDIIKVELNGEYLRNSVFKQIAEAPHTEFQFVSKESKDCLKHYVDTKGKNSEITKNVWKNLLTDSIALLKINDSREKIYTDSKKDKKQLLKEFDFIRKTNSYGIDEMDKYFNDFIEYESVLYGLDKYYRDHVNHVLQVWSIGIGLLFGKDSKLNLKLNDNFSIKTEKDFHFEIEEKEEKIERELTVSKSELFAMWTVIALCHDLGYPIEKTSQINRQAKKIINYFGNMQFTELDYSFSILNTFLVEKFLNIISSKVVKSENTKPENTKIFQTSIQTKYRDKLSKSLEDYKHGIYSSLLLFKNLTYFLETDYSINTNYIDACDAKQFYIRKEILRSIAGHTCPKLYHNELNTLSFLLILCDELQEWNRPKFDSFIGNHKEDQLTIEIKELSLKENDIQKIHILMNYKEIETNVDIEKYLVVNRYKNIHYLLRSAKEDTVRKVFFQWEIKFKDDINYNFCFDTSKDSFNMLSVTKGKDPLGLYDEKYK
jgi:hypothetical protein